MKNRYLSPQLLSIVERIADHLPGESASALIVQARQALVSAETEGRSVDVLVPRELPLVPISDGPVHPIPAVMTNTHLAGEVIVWVRSGRFVGMEQSWYADEPPNAWPETNTLEFD